ncbi:MULTISPECIES: hypothetical protein [Pseudomonas syringae group]|uniref:Uncharacterized protein n=1 Tax=Pseudomonas coronafaciens pv. striafaciens TaxID=235276 RepID=A0A3M4XZX7_9PSED|nr:MULTISPECIES: hypothetical protein [Pseudomonas syringae group]MBS7413561.1 hypothetical protein [Pseudomonas syringae]RMR81756.1 hypothetical protein ALP78_01894 [Pseudomonas coronafaciens pv. striafaciens]
MTDTYTASLPSISAAGRESLQHMLTTEGSEQLAAILQRPRPEGFTLLDEIQVLGAASSFGRWADDIELLNTLKSVLFDDELNALGDSTERVTRSVDSPVSDAGPEHELAKAAFDIAQSHQRESHSPSVRAERIDRARGDYPRLLNTLRARLRDVKTGTCMTNSVFMAVADDSPLFAGVAFGSSILQQFKTLLRVIARVDPAGDIDEDLLPGVRRKDLRYVLDLVDKTQMDFRQPFTCVLHVRMNEGRPVHSLQLQGVSLGRQPAYATLSDLHLRVIRFTDSLTPLAPHLQSADARCILAIRDDQAVSLHGLLDYYGVDIPLAATRDDLLQAITALLPGEREAHLAMLARALPFTLAEHQRFMLDTSQVYTFRQHKVQAHGTDDYGVIDLELEKEMRWHLDRCRTLLNSYRHFGASLQDNENALLAMFQQAGGITLKLVVYDSDGHHDVYREQHTVNPWRAKDLAGYFDAARQELSSYMINTIRYGEAEGAINIERLIVEVIVPNPVQRRHSLSDIDIEAFDIRSKEPPFLYVDPLALGAYDVIRSRFVELTEELREVQWDVGHSVTLQRAVRYLLAHYQEDLPALPEAQRQAAYARRLNDAVNTYYRVIAQNLEDQQRLQVVLQPTQPEFVARELCRYLGLNESCWPVIARSSFDISYQAGWINTGTFFKHEESAGYRTLLSVVYDEDLRRELALADNRDERLGRLAQALADKPRYTASLDALQAKLTGLFDANIAFVNNGQLPARLTAPQAAFKLEAENYAIRATETYRALEAERLVLVSGTAAERLQTLEGAALSDSDRPVHCIELLSADEKVRLEASALAFRQMLSTRANDDDIQNMSTSAQHVLQLVHQVGGLIPVLGNFINLGFDIYDGNDEGIAMDAVNIIAELVLCKMRTVPPRVLGVLMLQGTNIWTMSQQVQALGESIKANDYEESVKNFGFMLVGLHSALHCGISAVKGLWSARPYDQQTVSQHAVPDRSDLTETVRHPEHSDAIEGEHVARRRPSTSSSHWRVSEDGQISERPTGRKVTRIDWNGNAMVEGGARAVLLGGISEKIYMLNGFACRAVSGVVGTELRPLHALDLEAGQWRRRPQSTVDAPQLSRFAHTEDFPLGFSGRPERFLAPANTVSWYDNCVATLETVSVRVIDADSRVSQQTMALGVIEHKYVTERNGHVEVLEHAGTDVETTAFIRADGSRMEVARMLPAIPAYKPEIQAEIIAAQGMFVTVRLSDTLQGLVGRKTVAGVLATLSDGSGQELVIEADRGVHYRGTVPIENFLALAPGETLHDQPPVALTLQKISPKADPKRALPHLWRDQSDYRNGIAHDDFALELFYGSKAANEAYARNPQWVARNIDAVAKIKSRLPSSITTLENPFYVLDTPAELAILFAARNQAALANTLLGHTIEWGAASRSRELSLGENILKQLRLNEPLLAAQENIPPLASERSAFVSQLQEKLARNNLMMAEVSLKSGEKAWFAHSPARHLGMLAGHLHDEFYLSHSGSVIDDIEACFTDPSRIESIAVLSLDDVPETDARRIFLSSQRGYTYESVTSLEQPAEHAHLSGAQLQLHIDDALYPERTRGVGIASAAVDLTGAEAISSGPKRGSYSIEGRDYVKLDNGRIYRADWDERSGVFLLVPPQGRSRAETLALPWVRHIGGHEFTLINRPALKGGNVIDQMICSIRTRRPAGSLATHESHSAHDAASGTLQVHHEDLHIMNDDVLVPGKLNVPSSLFHSIAADRDGYVRLEAKAAVPESCISSTEFLVSKYAGGQVAFDYRGESLGDPTPLVPNVEVVALQDGQPVSLNITTTALDDWISARDHSDYFVGEQSFPEIGEGIGFIERGGLEGSPSSDYPFHFMFVAGKVLDQNGQITGVLASDLSEPAREPDQNGVTPQLPARRNWNLGLFPSIDSMRGSPEPDSNAYVQEHYYSVWVRAVRE